jgi:hypothetical protein
MVSTFLLKAAGLDSVVLLLISQALTINVLILDNYTLL